MATFEEQYRRLEDISKKIQEENLSLDRVHELYKEGIALANKCTDYIEKLKRDVEQTRK